MGSIWCPWDQKLDKTGSTKKKCYAFFCIFPTRSYVRQFCPDNSIMKKNRKPEQFCLHATKSLVTSMKDQKTPMSYFCLRNRRQSSDWSTKQTPIMRRWPTTSKSNKGFRSSTHFENIMLVSSKTFLAVVDESQCTLMQSNSKMTHLKRKIFSFRLSKWTRKNN